MVVDCRVAPYDSGLFQLDRSRLDRGRRNSEFVAQLPVGQSTVHQVRLEDSAVEIIHLEAQGLVRTVTRRRRQPLSGSSSVRSSSVTSFGSALPRTSAMTKFIIFPSALAPFA